MTDPSSPAAAVARWIIDRESLSATAPGTLASAIERAFARLENIMCTLIGPTGFQAVMARAAHLSKHEWPWIANSQIDSNATVMIQQYDEATEGMGAMKARVAIKGLAGAIERDGAAHVKNGAAQVLTHAIALFSEFIGEDLTFRLLRRAWPDLPVGNPADEEPNR